MKMKLDFFYLYDKVISEGSVVTCSENGKGYEIEKVFFDVLDLVVIRHISGREFEISLNRMVEAKIKALLASDVKNKRQRIYKLLRTREVSAIDDLETRIQLTPYTSEGLAFGITNIWEAIAKNGNYKENVGERTIALDHLIYERILEYDTHCYYSMTAGFGSRVFPKEIIPFSQLDKMIDPNISVEDTSKILMTLGYEFSPESLTFSIQKEDSCVLENGFMVGTV